MVDVLTPEQRRYNMSRIRARDTRPEMIVRRGLHRLGFRFQLHRNDLPGKPDLVLPGARAVVLVHGCFWHGHSCPMCVHPATRPDFWTAKIESNRDRDRRSIEKLRAAGWRVLTVWECALRGTARLPLDEVLARCAVFMAAGDDFEGEIAGVWQNGQQ
jgi:DNA mismatch endonuclease (patch repair protein)